MPTYDYKCKVCNTNLVVAHPINDTPTVICGQCNTERVKSYSAPGVSFSGSGWGSDR